MTYVVAAHASVGQVEGRDLVSARLKAVTLFAASTAERAIQAAVGAAESNESARRGRR
jgi:hypothetical protein